MTIKETLSLINILRAENDESNNELIAFYERKISEAIGTAFNKVFK